MSFYTVQVEIDRDGTPGLARQKRLVPGSAGIESLSPDRPARTGSVLICSKPLTDHMGRAFSRAVTASKPLALPYSA